MRSKAGTGVLFAAALLLLPGRPLHAQDLRSDTGFTELILQFRIERGPERIIAALGRSAVVYVPLAVFLEMAELRVTDSAFGRRIAGVIEPEAAPFWFDTEGGTRGGAGGTGALAPLDAVWRDGDLFVAAPLLGEVFGVGARVDWGELSMVIVDAAGLPVRRRLEREARRQTALAAAGRAAAAVPRPAPLPEPFADGAVLDYGLTLPTDRPEDYAALSAGAGVALVGGNLAYQGNLQRVPGGTQHDGRVSWVRGWPERRVVRQLRVGYTFLEGQRLRAVRGAAVTNVPVVRPAEFGTDVYEGRLGPGWELELLSSGRLVSYAVADERGRFALPVPLSYGPNAAEIVAYGPGGEQRRLSRAFVVPAVRLPARRFEYFVGGGVCQEADPCAGVLLADARYGLSRRVTARAGVEGFRRDSLGDTWHPYGALALAPVPALAVSLEGTLGALASASALYQPNAALQLEAGHTRFERSDAGALFGVGVVDRQSDVVVAWMPGEGPLQLLGALRDSRGASPTTSATGGVKLRLSGATAGLLARRTTTRRPAGRLTTATLDASLNALLGPRLPLLGRSFVIGAVTGSCGQEFAGCRPEARAGRLGLSRRFGVTFNVEAAVSWTRDADVRGPVTNPVPVDRTVVDLTITTTLPYLRSVSRTGYSAQYAYAGSQVFEGSVMWDRRGGRLRFDDGRSVGLAGINGVVFQDRNGNGVQDEGEEGVAEALLRIGSRAAVTDSLGRFSSFELPSFEWAVIELDTLGLRDPTWIPVASAIVVRPSPNGFRFVPVPLVEGQELSGTVTLDGRPVGGVPVRAFHVESGEARTLTTFEDGTFYAPAVRAGTYRLTVPADIIGRLRAFFAPVTVAVTRSNLTPPPARLELVTR